jgi:hypothetical protein
MPVLHLTRPVAPLLAVGALLLPACPARGGPVRLPNGAALHEVSFERHGASLLGTLGCNAGSCHGSFQGKGGFRLSLFGHAPEQDYLALTRDGLGRRVNPADPDRSLVLLKPAAQVAHEGGRRFARGSWQYQVFREWIAHGARWSAGRGTVRRLEVRPEEHRFHRPGETVRLAVTVEFDDGTRADLTPFCDFRARDDSVAEVSPAGEVRGLRPGDTALIVSYRGHLVTARVLVPVPVESGFVYPPVPEANYIDREVFAKLRRLNLVPSDLCGDADFLRRVTIDTIGSLPAPAEVRAFLADRNPHKRAKKVEELLAHPLRAALWATKLCDLTGNNVDVLEDPAELRPKRAKMWHDWFRRRIADNVPYDQIVRGVLCATSRDGLDVAAWMKQEAARTEAARQGFASDYADRPSLDLFWRRTGGDDFFPLEQMAERTAAAFLGVRIECAQCHKHPYDRWTQRDYRAYANVFAQVKFGSSPELRAATQALLDERRQAGPATTGPPVPRLREVYVSNQSLRRLSHPETNGSLKPMALGGPEIDLDRDARAQLFAWLVRPDNPFFARSLVNRVWAKYFGTGLVEPVDNFSVANPPSNERLLDALARDFVAHGYDLRHLERTILNSRTYQLSALPNATNADDRHNFSRAAVRRLPAEVVVDVLNAALGVTEDFGPDVPPGSRAVEIAPNRIRNEHLAYIFRIFGRPARTAACDCERSMEPALPQTLFLLTDPTLLNKITTGRLQKLLAEQKTDEEILDELFLATLGRFPDANEKRSALEYVQDKKDRQAAFVDTLWALLNTREFILNH